MKLFYAVKPETYKLVTGTLWTFHPKKLEQDSKTISLVAGRRDTAAFQLLIAADEPWILNVGRSCVIAQNHPMTALRLEARCKLACTLQIEDMHYAETNQLYADALLSYPTLELKPYETRAVWCEINIPADTAPGKYSLTLRMLESDLIGDEAPVGEVTAELEVLSCTLPEARDNKFHLDLWQHASNIGRKAETPLWSDEHFEVLERYIRSLGELGQKAATIVASEVPWAGQGCEMEQRIAANLFEYSIISTVRHPDGSFECDYTAMQRYIDLCVKYGIDREIELFGLCGVWNSDNGYIHEIVEDYPDSIRVRYYDEVDGVYRFMRKALEIDWYIQSLEQYFIRTGQIERVRVAADEPAKVDVYRKTIHHLRELVPAFRFKAAINHSEFIEEFREEIYDFVPYIRPLAERYDAIRTYMDTLPGKRFLYYVCCGPSFPNTFLSSPLTESLYLCVLASYARLDGFLRWNYTVWTDHPRTDNLYYAYRTGDTHFVYPQYNGAPLLSLRYKLLKRGIGLYELLERLRATGNAASLEKAFDLVLREKDITRLTAHQSMEEIGSIEDADYTALRRYLLETLGE